MDEPSSRGHGKAAHGGKAAGRRVKLPRGASRPIKVYINGQLQREGVDYTLHEGEAVFREPILKEDLSSLSPFRKFALGIGVVGTYQKNETVDVEYSLPSGTQFASDLPVLPD